MKKTKFVLALSMAAVMGIMSGCSSPKNTDTTSPESVESTKDTKKNADNEASTSIKVCWWGNQARNDMTKQAVDLYMEQNPEVKIDIEFTDWSGYWDKLSAMAAGGNLPDIIQMDHSYLKQYQESNQLADITPYLESGVIQTEKIPQSIIESGSIDGKCYAMSLGSNALSLIYNKDITDEAGVVIPEHITTEELLEIGNTIYEKTGVKTYYEGGLNGLIMMARSNDSNIFDELAANDLTSTLEHFEYVDQFARAESALTPELIAEKNPSVVETNPITDGTSWNCFSFSNQFIALKNASGGANLELSMFPSPQESDVEAMFLKPAQFFAISETSQSKDEAAKFIDWFINSEECNEILLGERGVPVNTDIAKNIKEKVDADTAKTFDYINKIGEIATPIDDPAPAGRGEVEAVALTYVEQLRYGDGTAQEIAEKFVEKSYEILTEAAK
ncbi:carbohydrate ABC transporter substrate-binding protein [Clostridium sp. chh4-2]|uniref:ABC transporter substrate-binding protein n=1 Tax=Clostridium sp. chh4-2 TaxID=2067550 RepID=UPI000CCDCF35|nr:extracellular solute-binding protein [Clostridium sp. chh4-2]PNV61636.1 carbohydrate ABC transporter substrate-binding protein [Clostridium sp. chh4-2]